MWDACKVTSSDTGYVFDEFIWISNKMWLIVICKVDNGIRLEINNNMWNWEVDPSQVANIHWTIA